MKNQQQAEREEQQRIKNLVLNYDLQQNEDQDGGTDPEPIEIHYNTNIHTSIQATNGRRRFTTTGWRDRTRIGAKDLVNSN
jgi:regulator of nonsense transcripts 2